MSKVLHCDCDVNEDKTEYFFHLPNCLVGAVLTIANALIIQDGNDAEGMGATEVLGVFVRDGLADISNATMGES